MCVCIRVEKTRATPAYPPLPCCCGRCLTVLTQFHVDRLWFWSVFWYVLCLCVFVCVCVYYVRVCVCMYVYVSVCVCSFVHIL